MDIEANIKAVRERIAEACRLAGRTPDDVKIVAVTKSVATADIVRGHRAGLSDFGENRVQEADAKISELSTLAPRPAWHMIGHLQMNKVKVAVQIFDMFHSVDSIELAERMSRYTERALPVLLQVNVSGEVAKYGFPVDEVKPALDTIARLPGLTVEGLMTIAPIMHDAEQSRPVFRELRRLQDSCGLKHLSMGMTNDFEVAIEEGATMVRIGRAIFGERTR
ncbi:MAG: YggS family pyridoxal phosphate-dependent enzyme [Chloroflexi bacterium]|nr:YggS family pyridoxal phosphate-dependent enzyme [Chloroflexota bacterium]